MDGTGRMKKPVFKFAVILVVAIALKLTFENSLHASRVDLKLGGPAFSLELRTKLGQNFAVALFSGFR